MISDINTTMMDDNVQNMRSTMDDEEEGGPKGNDKSAGDHGSFTIGLILLVSYIWNCMP